MATSTFSSLISSTTFSFSDSLSEGSRMTENNRDPRFPTRVRGVNQTILDPDLFHSGLNFAHVRCAVARVCVLAKFILKSVCNVHACGSFSTWDVRSHFCTLFGTKQPEKAIFVLIKIYFRISYPVLEHPFLLQHLSFCFRTFFSALELLFLFQNVLFCFRTPKKC